MSIDIDVSHNFDELEAWVNDVRLKAAIKAMRQSMNRTLVTLQKESVLEIRRRLKLKAREVKKEQLFLEKAKNTLVKNMEASILYKKEPLSLMRFVSGRKDPRKQRGIAVKKRKPVRVQIIPGKTVKLKKAFIADINSKQVFKRKPGTKRRAIKQSVPSIAHEFENKGMRKRLEPIARKRMGQEFPRNFSQALRQAAKRRNKKRFKK